MYNDNNRNTICTRNAFGYRQIDDRQVGDAVVISLQSNDALAILTNLSVLATCLSSIQVYHPFVAPKLFYLPKPSVLQSVLHSS